MLAVLGVDPVGGTVEVVRFDGAADAPGGTVLEAPPCDEDDDEDEDDEHDDDRE